MLKINSTPISYKTLPNKTPKSTEDKSVPNFSSATQVISLVPQKALNSLKFQKMFLRLIGSDEKLNAYNLNKLEGIQNGIDVFKGMTMKQIAFATDEIHSIMTVRGCRGLCSHCYAEAEIPVIESTENNLINKMAFEDFKTLTNGFKELSNRLGFNINYPRLENKVISLIHDADGMDVALKDCKGIEHAFPELTKTIIETTGQKGIFDTSGWNPKNKKSQEKAEKIVKYYSKPENADELYQFNISINPFHSIYNKSLELKEKGYDKASENLYNIYIKRMSNTLFTCIPLLKNQNFGIITRAFNDKTSNMQGYRCEDLKKIIKDIKKDLSKMCKDDINFNQINVKCNEDIQKIMDDYSNRLNSIDDTLKGAGRLKKLYSKKNPKASQQNISNLFSNLESADEIYEILKTKKRPSDLYFTYYKMIDSNGKVYLNDTYRIIPTDIQFNFSNKNKNTQPIGQLVDDFIVTSDML